jgi:hypothetical protein
MELLITPCRNQNLNDEAGLERKWNAWPLAGGHALIFGLPYFAGQHNEPSNVRLAGIPKNRKWMAMGNLADTPAAQPSKARRLVRTLTA